MATGKLGNGWTFEEKKIGGKGCRGLKFSKDGTESFYWGLVGNGSGAGSKHTAEDYKNIARQIATQSFPDVCPVTIRIRGKGAFYFS